VDWYGNGDAAFKANRTIAEYVSEIWNAATCPVT
jgi:hypothetical protein